MDERTILQKIGDAVADYAPGVSALLLASGIGAPAAAGVAAVGALGRAFGCGSAAKPEEVLAAISADPEIRLKAMIAENNFQLAQRGQDIEELKTHLQDVQDARRRQTESEKNTGKRDINQYALAWLLVIGFFVLTGSLLYFSYNGKPIVDSTGVLFMLLGALSAAFGGVIQYFFGSSAGSAAKSATINSMAEKKGG